MARAGLRSKVPGGTRGYFRFRAATLFSGIAILVAVVGGTVAATGAERHDIAPAYFYQRALSAELVIKDAMASGKTQRVLTVYNSLFDEYDVLARGGVGGLTGPCYDTMKTLVLVALQTFSYMDGQSAGAKGAASVQDAVDKYRGKKALCEKEPGIGTQVPMPRIE
ncbi:hypothetical protein K9U40_18910 [Xanthobacter autotrophicus]|uniref:hypothetical protein n=1 Tax=Xanthobacter TaxID=279 RepID=UPI0024AB5427|nr:hypothetical protein [Xanthobacter autotrophicus]MDI4666378.1 hypothetical protein [Xanthobacter autotrophicus]